MLSVALWCSRIERQNGSTDRFGTYKRGHCGPAPGNLDASGYFTKLSGTIEAASDGRLESVEATIDAGSIDTREEERGAHQS